MAASSKSATKPHKVLHNVLGENPKFDPKVRTSELPFKVYRPGSTIELDEKDAAQQIKIGHVEPIK